MIWQQAITWTNVDPDLCRHMASLGHTALTFDTMLKCLTIDIHSISLYQTMCLEKCIYFSYMFDVIPMIYN